MRQLGLPSVHDIAIIGNHLPRRCGIATFTTDLQQALCLENPQLVSSWVVAMNDSTEGYPYPHQVRFTVSQPRLADYRLAAEFVNMNQPDVVCLQHEYGIFGGRAGSHILDFLEALRLPVVTTLHTVLADPDAEQREVMLELGRLSDRLVVMSQDARAILTRVYGIPVDKVVHIGHGIPDVAVVDPHIYKAQFDVAGRTVLLTFGLLSPGKGVEYMLRALPQITAVHPDVVYLVLGATHPHVKREHGEEYRNGLHRLVRELGMERHVIFHNRFVELDELCEFLGAADIYVTPYLGENQITSGTLAYALGAGKAVVSTPYAYAREMLSQQRGRLVPFRDAAALAGATNDLLDNAIERHAMRKRAYTFCRDMTWREVGRQYLQLFAEAKAKRLRSLPAMALVRSTIMDELPESKLQHMLNLTDDTGMLQHARMTVPDRVHGYCTDDNARALIVALGAGPLAGEERELQRAIVSYLSFLEHAFNETTGRFKNFMSYERRWLEDEGSEDCHGRALWAVGIAAQEAQQEWMLWQATRLFKKAMPALEHLQSPRTQAFGLCGLRAYLSRFAGDRTAHSLYQTVATAMEARFIANRGSDWPWGEDVVSYDNGRIPLALMQAGRYLELPAMTECGLTALRWLLAVQTSPEGHFVPIGNRGWYVRGGSKAGFDQQPLEASAMIDACCAAFSLTGEAAWASSAKRCFDWFLGRNDLRTPLYDYTTGGCRDGLNAEAVNENQGAESTLAWLMALQSMQRLASERLLRPAPAVLECGVMA